MSEKSLAPKPDLQLGRYRHYKGGEYEAVMLSMAESTMKWCVVYKPLYEHEGMPDYWTRDVEDFQAVVEYEGEQVPRFSLLDIVN